MTANQRYRKALPGTDLEYYDARQACEDIKPGSYDKLPYTSRILAENLVNRRRQSRPAYAAKLAGAAD